MSAGRREEERTSDCLATEAEIESSDGAAQSHLRYVLLVAALCLITLMGVRAGNMHFAPLLNDPEVIEKAAAQLGEGLSYHTYDLNIETRQLRADHIATLPDRPYAAIMGASHWQEGVTSVLAPGVDLYNAHVHRDYYEDILGVVEMFASANKLPKNLLITIRDNQFTPVENRTDWLWVPIMPYYWDMTKRLGIEGHRHYLDGFTPQLRQRLSMPLLQANVERYIHAPIKPYASSERSHPTLDTLLPDGSIAWSEIHNRVYTPARTRSLAQGFAQFKRVNPPEIDPFGAQSVDAALGWLKDQGVNVYLTHPPYNPTFWEAVQGSEYMVELEHVKKLTRDLAAKHGFGVVGSFDPAEVGCTSDMYIDSEHSNAECLSKIVGLFLDKIEPHRQ